MSTPAVRFLEQAGVEFDLHHYDVGESVGEGYGEAVAVAIGASSDRVFKTLLATVDGDHVVAVVPVSRRLSVKALARAAGGKKAAMADPADAERETGYVTGGISPFGQRRSHRTFVDDSVLSFDIVFVSAGKRGLQLEIAPADLVRLTAAAVAPLL